MLPLIHLKDIVRANKSGLNCYVNETLAGMWGRQRSQMADGPCADHFQLPASS